MTRRRYRQDPETLKLVEVTDDDYMPSKRGDSALWNDRHYENLSTTDGVDISSRSKHRSYMRQHGLCTHDDFKGEFAKQERAREAYRKGERPSITKADIQRAIHQLTRR